MPIYQRVDAVVVNEDGVYALTELTRVSGLDEEILRELIDNELLDIRVEGPDRFRVTPQSLQKVTRAARVARDFELGASAVALAVCLLERIDVLEEQLARHAHRDRH